MTNAMLLVPWAIAATLLIGWTIFCFKSEEFKNSKRSHLKWEMMFVTAVWAIGLPTLVLVLI